MKATWTLTILALALAAAMTALSPWASSSPDALERVIADGTKAPPGEAGPSPAPLGDYRIPGLRNRNWSTALAGLAGVAVVFVAGLALARVLRERTKHQHDQEHGGGTPTSR